MPQIIYEGPSRIDGSPLVVLTTNPSTKSENQKTGDMLQTYILQRDIPPIEAVKSKRDYAICGDCKHRGTSCYVNIAHGPTAIWRAYKRGKSNITLPPEAAGHAKKVRLGAYGDPSAVPFELWQNLCKYATAWTGYTHAWKDEWCDKRLKRYCMASVDSEKEAQEAKKLGWRYFRVKSSKHPTLQTESVCPASEEAGHKIQCERCTVCNGTHTGIKGNIVINVHGVPHKIKKFEENAK